MGTMAIPPPPEPWRQARESRNRAIWRAQRKQAHFAKAAKRRARKHRERYADEDDT